MVASSNPSSGVNITLSATDMNGQSNGSTQFTRTYAQGAILTLTAPAATSTSFFGNWTGCDSASGYTCTVTISTAKNVTANYTTNSYTITASAGAGGTISPSGTVNVNYGGSETYTITPNTYYGIQSVVVDGTSVGAVSQYTFSGVTGNHTISATFVLTNIAVTSPNGGEQWVSGSTQTVTWAYQGKVGSYVKIDLLKAGALLTTLSAQAPVGSNGQGSYSWTVTQQPSNNYQIRVTSTTKSSVTDTSNGTFSVIAPAPSVTVTAPNGGEKWAVGTTQNVTWQYVSNPGTTVKIDLYKSGVFSANIVASVSIGTNGTGSYAWAIPSSQVLGSDYTVMVTTNSGYSDTSNGNFSITAPAPSATITVGAPNGGETWSKGTKQTIKWTYTGNPGATVKIDLYQGGVFNSSVTASASIGSSGTGSFKWAIPSKLASGSNYTVVITSTSNPAVTDSSNSPFTLH